MNPSQQQQMTLENMKLDATGGKWVGLSVVLPYPPAGPNSWVIVNEHGSASVFPSAMIDQAIKGIPQ